MKPADVTSAMIQPECFPPLPGNWESGWETLDSSRQKLFIVRHKVKELRRPYRVLFVIHGQGEHGGRYLHFPHYLQKTVSEIALVDLRGHGRSEGLRGHVDRFDQYVDDVTLFIQHVRSQHHKINAEIEYHLFAHSLGGLIGLRLLHEKPEIPFASATISAPLLKLKMEVPIVKKAAAYALAQVWGSLQLGSELDPALLSRDPAVQRAYQVDRLVHSKATPSFFVGMQKALAETRSWKEGFQCPLQFIVPLADEIVDPRATQGFVQQLEGLTQRLETYEGFRHEAFNELGKEAVFEDIESWILQNPPKKPA